MKSETVLTDRTIKNLRATLWDFEKLSDCPRPLYLCLVQTEMVLHGLKAHLETLPQLDADSHELDIFSPRWPVSSSVFLHSPHQMHQALTTIDERLSIIEKKFPQFAVDAERAHDKIRGYMGAQSRAPLAAMKAGMQAAIANLQDSKDRLDRQFLPVARSLEKYFNSPAADRVTQDPSKSHLVNAALDSLAKDPIFIDLSKDDLIASHLGYYGLAVDIKNVIELMENTYGISSQGPELLKQLGEFAAKNRPESPELRREAKTRF